MYIIWFYFILFYFFWKAYKRAHSNHNSQKKTKKNKTDKNYQISEDLKYQGIFWKNAFLEVYIYNLVFFFFWKTCKGTFFNHNRQKNPQNWQELPNFWILEILKYVLVSFEVFKSILVYIIRKTILSAVSLFFISWKYSVYF